MRRKFSIALTLVLVSSFFAQVGAVAEDKQPRTVVSGWIPYYSVRTVMPFIKKLPTDAPTAPTVTCEDNEYSPEDIALLNSSYLFTNKDLMKEVMPFWYTLKSPTLIRDDYTTGNPSWPIADALCLMRKTGLKIIPTMTDGTSQLVLSGYLTKPETRTTIVKSIVDLVNKNGFDGIDLDFESFAFVDGNTTWAKTAPQWVLFIKELSTQLHASQKLLSVTTPYAYNPTEKSKGYTVYAWAEIASSIDRLRIMTYDYSVAKPGPIGPISWVEKTVQYAVSIMPASKVFIGLPGYGRDWITSVNGSCPVSAPPGLTAGAKAATFKMNYAAAKAVIDGAVPSFDEKFSEATYSYSKVYNGLTAKGASTSCSVARTVWYQNDRSYAERAQLVGKYQLGGVALWTLGMEDAAATIALRNSALAIAPEPIVSTLTFTNLVDSRIGYGESFTINGLLTRKDGTPVTGLNVHVQMKRSSESTWAVISESTTNEEGKIAIPINLANNAEFRLVTDGTWERSDSLSTALKVMITSKLQIKIPTSAKQGAVISIGGFVYPQIAGQQVQLQKLIAGKWQKIGNETATDSKGEFSLVTSEVKRGVITVRVQILVDNEAMYSAERLIVVH
ncbi:unannotated protein [freshwater metagenome]|uniref:Unannotated protein n=1 Tax=freshwater metagenome TaxID=449393 RepID=A0A6J7A1G1_9ZZZZ|nr:hypothetical protein [Actinomycetota bacterium]